MTWMQPTTVDAVVRARADNPEAVVVAGGTFLGILVRAGMLEADDWISLQDVRDLTGLHSAGDLSIGAMVRHRRLELDEDVRGLWPGVSAAFQAVASPRVRNVATVGGVLADADYASYRSTSSSPGTTAHAWRRTSSSPGSSSPGLPGQPSTASCAPAPRRTGPPRRW